MNIFHKVTLQSLKKNRTRTTVTIIGIILSAAMICAVTTFVSSMQNYAVSYAVYSSGDWHGAVYDASESDLERISGVKEVSGFTYGQRLGYAKTDSKNGSKPYLYVLGGQKKSFFERMPIHLIAGELPKNESEIILPEHLLVEGGQSFQVGDVVTLELGRRMLDGFSMGQNNPCTVYDRESNREIMNDEVLEVRETRTYTVTGIYKRPSFEDWAAPGYTALTVADEEFADGTGFDVYFKMKDPARVYEFMDGFKLGGTWNTEVLMYSGVSRYSSFLTMLVNLAVIVIGLIMFGSVSLIYNAFSISVSERTKQFGLLSSVGATKRQLKKMVLFEALAVSTVGIPLGILAGIGGIGVTLLFIGHKFISIMGDFDLPLRMCVSWRSVVIAVIVALVTVLISAWIPSKRATGISAVEAIRQSADVKGNQKSVRTSAFQLKLFGLPGVLAGKYYRRSKRKYRATVLSLFMSIVLFVSAAAFTDYLMESVGGGLSGDGYDLQYSIDGKDENDRTEDEILELLLSDPHVTGGTYLRSSYINGSIENSYITEEFQNHFAVPASSEDAESEEESEAETFINGNAYFVSDQEFEKLLSQYGLSREDYFNKEAPLGIAQDGAVHFNKDKEKYETVTILNSDVSELHCRRLKDFSEYNYMEEGLDEAGNQVMRFWNDSDKKDMREIPYADTFVKYSLKTGRTITDVPFYVEKSSNADLNIIYPYSMINSVLPEEIRGYSSRTYFYLTTEDHKASYDNLSKILGENGMESMYLNDYAEREEMNRNLVTIIQVFSYGFIVLISLVAAANVFNTITTNINLRRREFAMLKSVGMTQKGFHKMMNYECLLYGSRALLFGLPASAGVTWLIYRAVNGGYETYYHLPWGAVGIAVLSVFLVVFATMMYAMSKTKKDNLIDVLKNENL